jgi:hypothetical protein
LKENAEADKKKKKASKSSKKSSRKSSELKDFLVNSDTIKDLVKFLPIPSRSARDLSPHTPKKPPLLSLNSVKTSTPKPFKPFSLQTKKESLPQINFFSSPENVRKRKSLSRSRERGPTPEVKGSNSRDPRRVTSTVDRRDEPQAKKFRNNGHRDDFRHRRNSRSPHRSPLKSPRRNRSPEPYRPYSRIQNRRNTMINPPLHFNRHHQRRSTSSWRSPKRARYNDNIPRTPPPKRRDSIYEPDSTFVSFRKLPKLSSNDRMNISSPECQVSSSDIPYYPSPIQLVESEVQISSAKQKRNMDREIKRLNKAMRKANLKDEIRKLLEPGVSIESLLKNRKPKVKKFHKKMKFLAGKNETKQKSPPPPTGNPDAHFKQPQLKFLPPNMYHNFIKPSDFLFYSEYKLMTLKNG